MPAELTPNQLKWVEALEGGDYKQGHGVLHRTTDNTWCCLGVACDLAHKDGVPLAVRHDHAYTYFNGNGGTLPTPVREWLGLDKTRCVPRVGPFGTDIARMNDIMGLTFREIAADIRAYGVR